MLELPPSITDLITFGDQLALSSREGKRIEFKQSFIASDLSEYTKVLASFANTLGGVILFGISDKPRTIIGDNEPIDEAKWADRLREDFDPEITFGVKIYEVNGLRLCAIGVDPSLHKPIISKKNRTKLVADRKGQKRDVSVIHEGSIYYRYAGQTKMIGFSELHNMLVERESQYLRKMMETLQVIQKVGLENAGVVDMSAEKSRIFMSKETAKGLSFIDKGNLVQEAGAPAYVVMGSVDLRQVVHAPLDDEDKNIPTEAAQLLSPVVKQVYGIDKIHASQVTQLMRHLKIEGDNHHSVVEKKMGRKYVTRAGIKALDEYIRNRPTEALDVFGSRAAKTRFGLSQSKDAYISDAEEIAVREDVSELLDGSIT